MAIQSFVVLLSILLLATSTSSRPMPPLSVRLQAEGNAKCWDSLMELRSCSGEVILFFLNGETYLGPSCCRAIRVIEHKCWATDAMLGALGFTAQEGDILRGYCDAAADDEHESSGSLSAPPPPPPPPPPTPATLTIKESVH